MSQMRTELKQYTKRLTYTALESYCIRWSNHVVQELVCTQVPPLQQVLDLYKTGLLSPSRKRYSCSLCWELEMLVVPLAAVMWICFTSACANLTLDSLSNCFRRSAKFLKISLFNLSDQPSLSYLKTKEWGLKTQSFMTSVEKITRCKPFSLKIAMLGCDNLHFHLQTCKCYEIFFKTMIDGAIV